MKVILAILVSFSFYIVAPPPVRAADNVVLITLDGLRWQEVFTGIDRDLATHERFNTQTEFIMERFWRNSSQNRAETLLPFIHNTVFKEGSYVGNRNIGSCSAVTNEWYFSYPGYSEILTGVVNNAIDSNAKNPNPERTMLELLDLQAGFEGKTAAFASWDVFPFIFNTKRSGVHVNAFHPEKIPADQFEETLTQLHKDIPTPWATVRNDAFTHHYAISYILREKPRVTFISYGETDDFAHDGKYDEYIIAAHRTDRFIQDVWETLQSSESYKDNTVLFITVDHGRGEEPIEAWRHHGSKRSLNGYMNSLAEYEKGIVGSEAVWMAALGPGVAKTGLITTGSECIGSNRIAATLLTILGEDYQELNPNMGEPITEFLH
ncbi:MAG: phosphoglyceromutase [Gammaproteobacteria bacterium]|nr:phosphoglyceromutase [Gammaproteobacteria bacterium]